MTPAQIALLLRSSASPRENPVFGSDGDARAPAGFLVRARSCLSWTPTSPRARLRPYDPFGGVTTARETACPALSA